MTIIYDSFYRKVSFVQCLGHKNLIFLDFIACISFFSCVFQVLLAIFIWDVGFNLSLLCTGTSLVMTVIRSFGNNHGHLGTSCYTQTGRTGKASFVAFWLQEL